MDNEDHQEEKIPHKDYSTTVVKEIKCSCQWTIYNFSFFVQGDNSNSIYAPDIESPVFKCGCNNELVWDINIVNLRDLEEEYLKIYIYVDDVEWHDYLSIDAKVSILDDKGKEAHTIKFKLGILSTESVDLVRKDYLMDKNNKILTDDKLIIVCEINAFAEVYAFSWNTEDNDNVNEDKICEVDVFRSRLKVSHDLQALLQNNLHDTIVVVKKKQFYVHKCILAARSRVFSAMFEQQMLEQANNTVIIEDMSSNVFEDILEFIYFGTLKNITDISNKALLEILIAADKYELYGLKEICEVIFSSKLLVSNAVEMLNLADFYHASNLKKYIIQFIIAHNQDFISNKEFDLLLNTHSHLIPLFLQEKSEESALELSNDFNNEENDENICNHHVHLPSTNALAGEKKWSVTQICIEQGKSTWKIHSVNLLFHNSNNMSDCIVSEKFTKDNINVSWQLFLYFKGLNNDSKDYISLLLQFSNENCCTHKIQAQYEFAILNAKEEIVNKMKSKLLTFDVNHSKLGETKFVKKDLLFNKKKNLLQDNTLVIVCFVTFGLNTEKRYGQKNTLNYCEHKFLLAVSDDLEKLLLTSKYSDITLIVGGKKFLLHRAVLAVRSPMMLNMINELFEKQGTKIVEWNDIDQAEFSELLLFIYSGKLNYLKHLAKGLYTKANRFQLEDLKCICEMYICKNLTVENVCDNFVFAHVNNVRKLKSRCSLYITDNLKAVIATNGYKSLSESRPKLLKDLLLQRHSS
ncbi:uncharacterized protein LOC131662841 [Phymastichus coffea]|uniref:uncharacterized protein LOC131662841 n=1 Tax=Phymastichus coffea TaxID=108790 RepID=UPI00273CC39B|nr:uncharacterized protein LOC131662841 [Phymastichus coffea]